MTQIKITEKESSRDNLLYLQTTINDLLSKINAKSEIIECDDRALLNIDVQDDYIDITRAELFDKISEIIAVKYKYDFFKDNIRVKGLKAEEFEILLTSLISADLDDDKKYIFDKSKEFLSINIDGFYMFRLQALNSKWKDIIGYLPETLMPAQLKEFVFYLLENKKKRAYIDGGKVYDSHFRRLRRCSLLGCDNAKITKEVLLSNCGEVEISGSIPIEDEKYLKEFYGDKIFFSNSF